MGIEKLPENSQVKLNQIMSDGKVTGEEVKGLTAAEQEALSSILGGKLPEAGEEVNLSTRRAPVEEQPQKKEQSWAEKLGIAAAGVAATSLIGAAIGGAIGFFGGGVGAVPGAVAGAKLGAVAGAAIFGLSACTTGGDEIIELPKNETNITNNISITVNSSVSDIINYLEKAGYGDKLDDIVALLASIKNDTSVMKAGMEKIFIALTEMGAKVDNLYESMDLKGDVIIGLLVENNARQGEILNAMSKNNAEVKAELEKILAAVKEGNKIGTNNGVVLNEILAKIKDAEGLGTVANDILNAILNKVTQGVKENKDMNTKTQALLQVIVAKIDKLDAGIQSNLKALLAKIDTVSDKNIELLTNILNKMDNQGIGKDYTVILDAIYGKLQESIDSNQNMKDGIYKLLNDIVNSLDKMDAGIRAAVDRIIAKLDEIGEETAVNLGEVIKSIQAMDADMKVIAAEVLDRADKILAELNVMDANQVNYFNAILAKLGQLEANDKAGLELLKAMLDKLTEDVENDKQTDAKVLAILQQILDKLDTISADQKAYFEAVLANFGKLSDAGKANVDKLLDAINKNTAVAKGTYDLVAALLDKVDKLGGKADSILEAITNISIGDVNVDLSTIENMLKELLDQSKANGDVLTDINSKLNLIAVTITGIKNEVSEGNEALLKKLQEILDKIPNGCKCEKLDLTVVIEKLDKIIEEIKKDPDGNHEGILDDLDEILG